MSRDDIRVIQDPNATVASLERMWLVRPPQGYDGKPFAPLIGSPYDQEPTTENPYWDIVRRLPLDRFMHHYSDSGHAAMVDGYEARIGREYVTSRSELTKTYAWSIPTPDDVQWVADLARDRGVVEVGAGTGYWAWQLAQSGVDVVAVDEFPGDGNQYCCSTQYHPVTHGGPRTARQHADRVLLLCWPPMSDMAASALQHYSGDLVVYIGEPDGGCTADELFFKRLDAEWDHIGSAPRHVTFSGIHCYIEAYRRKAVSQ